MVPATETRPIEVELVSAARAVVPGETTWVAVRLEPNRGWHTYWRYAGDVGSAPSVAWDLPSGWKAGSFSWPAPHRISSPPLASYGYERELFLVAPIEVPRNARVGSTARIAGRITWVVCAEECIADDVDLSIARPVVARAAVDSSVMNALVGERLRTPLPHDGWTTMAAVDESDIVILARPPSEARPSRSAPIDFFVDSAGVIDHGAPVRARWIDSLVELRITRSEYANGAPGRVSGVVVFGHSDSIGTRDNRAFEIVAPVAPSLGDARNALGVGPEESSPTSVGALLTAALFALLGGTLLNLMPCVLPVLSIKTFGIAQAAAHDERAARQHVMVFAGGVLVSMWVLVGVLLALRAAGTQVGWGYQLQSPTVVGALALLIFAAGLNMAGVFDLVPVGGSLSAAASRAPRNVDAFMGGVLVTALATPCSAPFLAAAVAYAVTTGAAESFVVFTALGLGLIWPLAMVAVVPRLRAWLPKPGAWMVTLRQVLAFPLFATVVWLAWVLGRQAGVSALVALLAACTLLAFGLWALGRFGTIAAPMGRRRLARVLAIASAAGALALISNARAQGASTQGEGRAGSATSPSGAEGALAWRPYSAELLEAERDSGRIVLLDFTADWCLTCKVNERVALASQAVRVAIRDHDVALLRADWTTRSSVVTRALAAFGRNSVPFVVIYPRARDAAPIILPTLLTSGIVTGALERAAASPSGARTSAASMSDRIPPSLSVETIQ
jgi:thiol:disulfide interchange protein DsbD